MLTANISNKISAVPASSQRGKHRVTAPRPASACWGPGSGARRADGPRRHGCGRSATCWPGRTRALRREQPPGRVSGRAHGRRAAGLVPPRVLRHPRQRDFSARTVPCRRPASVPEIAALFRGLRRPADKARPGNRGPVGAFPGITDHL